MTTRLFLLAFATVGVLLGGTPSASAANQTYGPLELSTAKLTITGLTAGKTYEVGLQGKPAICTPTTVVAAGKTTLDLLDDTSASGCEKLFDQPTLASFEVRETGTSTVATTLVPATIAGCPVGVECTVDLSSGAGWTLPVDLGSGNVDFLYRKKGDSSWSKRVGANALLDVSANEIATWNELVVHVGGKYTKLNLPDPEAVKPADDPPADPSALTGRCDAKIAEDHRGPLFYFEVSESGISRRPCGKRRAPQVIRPNTSVTVVVKHPSTGQPRIEMGGTIGVYDPPTNNSTGRGVNSGGATTYTTTEVTFAPRIPGSADITVEFRAFSTKVEVLVEKTYAGAIRIGVAGVFGGAQNRSYEAKMLPGSGQSEIVVTTGGDMDAELVLGAAAYLERGGRSYLSRTSSRWAPYFGIGLVNGTDNGLELLTSVHLGFEYEFNSQFSVALTAVARRVTRLADGLEVGGPAPVGDVLTRDGYAFGFAIVFNLSPEFLKLARSPGNAYFSDVSAEDL